MGDPGRLHLRTRLRNPSHDLVVQDGQTPEHSLLGETTRHPIGPPALLVRQIWNALPISQGLGEYRLSILGALLGERCCGDEILVQ